MSKNLFLRTAAVLLIGTGAAFAQTTAPAPTTAPKAGTTAPAPAATAPAAPKATAPAAPAPAAPKAAAPAPAAPVAAPAATAPKAAAPAAAPAPAAAMNTKPVNLNTATQAELETLHQVGPARAKDIIEARTKAKFKNWEDFVARNVVPKNAEEAIKAQARF